MTDKSLMPFGIHKGEKLEDVPADYLIFLYDNDKCGKELRSYIEENRETLDLEIAQKKRFR